jgi:hypothetical protein
MSSIRCVCSIENCSLVCVGRGFCSKHYQRFMHNGDPNIVKHTHEMNGMSRTHPVRRTWSGIKNRCFNENDQDFYLYGEKGITVCERWRYSLLAFYEDMGDKPSPLYSIDRRDGTGNYSCGNCAQCVENGWPMNCRWATSRLQSWNQGMPRSNTSGYIGASIVDGVWRARIGINVDGEKSLFYLGGFQSGEEAAIAYDIAAIFFRGDEAKTNIL